MEWNYDGSQIAITSKDKTLKIFDPRDNKLAIKIDGIFDGSKQSFIVPRKCALQIFQYDIYPNCYAGIPSINDNIKNQFYVI